MPKQAKPKAKKPPTAKDMWEFATTSINDAANQMTEMLDTVDYIEADCIGAWKQLAIS